MDFKTFAQRLSPSFSTQALVWQQPRSIDGRSCQQQIDCRINQGHSFPQLNDAYRFFPPISAKFVNFPVNLTKFKNLPLFSFNLRFSLNFRFLLPPILTMMHLCIMLYTYWTPLWLTTTQLMNYMPFYDIQINTTVDLLISRERGRWPALTFWP